MDDTSAGDLHSQILKTRNPSFKANSQQIYLTWESINFSVPLKPEDKLMLER
jgi:hypothetical protein